MEPLTIIAKLFILNVAAALDPPLIDSDILEEETCKEKDEGNEGGNGCRYFYNIVSILRYLKIQKQEALQFSRLL